MYKVRRPRISDASGRAAAFPLARHVTGELRACLVIDIDRKSLLYRSFRVDDGALREKRRELSLRCCRLGY